jgi:dihydroorotase
VAAVLDALCDGVIDCIATDHAPHTAEEKASDKPPNGVTGLETALAVTLEALYHTKRMPAEEIFKLLSDKPAAILGVPRPSGSIEIDTDIEWAAENFLSMACNTPFPGKLFQGKVVSYGG